MGFNLIYNRLLGLIYELLESAPDFSTHLFNTDYVNSNYLDCVIRTLNYVIICYQTNLPEVKFKWCTDSD